jgi:hypothetical protein
MIGPPWGTSERLGVTAEAPVPHDRASFVLQDIPRLPNSASRDDGVRLPDNLKCRYDHSGLFSLTGG